MTGDGTERHVAEPSRADPRAGAAGRGQPRRQQGLLFTDDRRALPRGHRLPRPDRVRAAGHHLPPARLLGPHRAGRADGARRHGSGSQRLYGFRDILVLKVVKRLLDTGVSLQQHPDRGRPPARARRRRPGPDHADERRRDRLRVHLGRRGRSTWCRAARASSASPSGASGARSRARSPSCPASAPTAGSGRRSPATSWQRAGRHATPADARAARASRRAGAGTSADGRRPRAGELHRRQRWAPKEQAPRQPRRYQDRTGQTTLDSGTARRPRRRCKRLRA